MTNPKFQIFKDNAGEFRFRLRARNGEIILHASEGYNSKQGAQNGIASVKVNAPIDSRYVKSKTTDNQHRFVLRAANHEPIGLSERYTTPAARDNGIASVKANAPTAPTEDLTLTNR